jgi:two-component system, NarL family, sensor kinase
LQRCALRIVQEALANAHRHASASHMIVTVGIESSRLMLTVEDDGIGMTHSPIGETPVRFGVGIPGMRARLQQFGGDIEILSGDPGTIIQASIPLNAVGKVIAA